MLGNSAATISSSARVLGGYLSHLDVGKRLNPPSTHGVSGGCAGGP